MSLTSSLVQFLSFVASSITFIFSTAYLRKAIITDNKIESDINFEWFWKWSIVTALLWIAAK